MYFFFFFPSTAMFFAFTIKVKETRKLFSLGGKKFLVCSSFGLGRLSPFLGGWGDKEVNEGQHLPCCFYLRLLLDTLCVIRNLYVNLLVSQSGGWRLMRRPAPTMLFLFAFVIRNALCRQKLYVNLLVSRHGQLTCRCCVRGTTLGIAISGFQWLFMFLFFTIRV